MKKGRNDIEGRILNEGKKEKRKDLPTLNENKGRKEHKGREENKGRDEGRLREEGK